MYPFDIAKKERLAALCAEHEIPVLWDEPMKNHTSFKIGGPAAAMCIPQNREQLRMVTDFAGAEEIKFWYIGNGSNLLVNDDGLDGMAVLLSPEFDGEITVNGKLMEAPAGKRLSAVCSAALAASLSGLEFAWGIPGSIGGAVYMNAGAYGGEIKDRLVWAEYLDVNGNIARKSKDELELSYRHSCFMNEEHSGDCIIRVAFLLTDGDKASIQNEMDRIISQRKDKQPLEYPSAGSTFKRPEGAFAAKLIDDCGLRGLTVGGAQVSEKHAGFVINKGNASCADVLELTKQVREIVRQKTGYNLELEIKVL